MITKVYRKLVQTLFLLLAKKRCIAVGMDVCVNRYCEFTANTIIGNNCHFNGMRCNGEGKIVIGDNFHSGRDCILITSDHNYDYGNKIPYDHTSITADIIIDENVWIGDRVIILKGVHIGEGAIIQAGSVVVKDIPSLSIAGGVPAKEFKMRDSNHYYHLKEERQYF